MVEVEQVVGAPIAAVEAVLRDMERFPEFMSAVESLRVLDRGPDYTVTEWVARLQGARFRWVERDLFSPGRIVYRQESGDLKKFEGEWLITAVDDSSTRVVLTTEFEFGIPMLAQLLNPVARVVIRQNALAMLDGIARHLA